MDNTWIPTWAATVWTVIFVGVMAVHCHHAIVLSGRVRAWHGTHILMSLGMIAMFWPFGSMPVPAGVGEAVFAMAAIGVLVTGVFDRVRNEFPVQLWAIAFVDLAGMAYMFAMGANRNAVLTLVLVAWFVLEAIGWATGALLRLLPVLAGEPVVVPTPVFAAIGPGTHGPAAERDATPVERTEPTGHTGHTRDLRITLALMSLGMAYMLLAMQYGTHAMAAMPHMSGM